MKWKDLSNTTANLLEQVDIRGRDTEYKIGDIIYNERQIVTKAIMQEVLDFQPYSVNSKNQLCYFAKIEEK